MDEDRLLYSNWKRGESKAFDALFNKYYKKLCFIALKTVKNLTDAEDIVQELFISIYNSRERINIESSFKNYLFASLHYKCINYLKKQNKKYLFDNVDSIEIPDHSEIPSEILEKYELEKKIFEEIDALPKKCKQIFELSRFEKLKYKEIADKLNISIKTVETQIGIALKKLSKIFYNYLNCCLIGILVLFDKLF